MGAGQDYGVIELTRTHEGGGYGSADAEKRAADDVGARGFDKLGQFVERRVGGPVAELGEAFETDQEGAFGTRIEQPAGDIRIGRTGLGAAVRS